MKARAHMVYEVQRVLEAGEGRCRLATAVFGRRPSRPFRLELRVGRLLAEGREARLARSAWERGFGSEPKRLLIYAALSKGHGALCSSSRQRTQRAAVQKRGTKRN